MLKLTILGYMGAYPYQGVGTTGYLLQSGKFNLLLDAGSGTLLELEKTLDPLKLDAVLLSHYHYDHIADLGVLQYYFQLFPTAHKKPILPIYGHTEDAEHYQALNLPNVTQGFPYSEKAPLTLGPFTITFMKTKHPVPCFAMRIVERATGKVLVFTGDSGYLPAFVEFAHEADVFLADTYLFNGHENHPAHFTAHEAGQLAEKAQVKQLILTHLPQLGDLKLLKAQAIDAAHDNVPVTLASQQKEFDI